MHAIDQEASNASPGQPGDLTVSTRTLVVPVNLWKHCQEIFAPCTCKEGGCIVGEVSKLLLNSQYWSKADSILRCKNELVGFAVVEPNHSKHAGCWEVIFTITITIAIAGR